MSDDTKHDPPDRTPLEELRDWEIIQVNENDTTERLTVMGGWLYRSTSKLGVAMVYVSRFVERTG